MEAFDFYPRTRLVFGLGALARLGELARELKVARALLVADRGIVACGYVDEAAQLLGQAGISVCTFHDFDENPDTAMIEAGRAVAAAHDVAGIIALGGGSSLDCAKGINFVLRGGGEMRDYWGHNKFSAKPDAKPMLPMIGIPTTAGTGSDAQSYALISDAATHTKMACGDSQAAFRLALLDPRLTVTQPKELTATAGYDAISHAVEAYVTKKGNALSTMHAREAWRLLEANYERVLLEPENIEARGQMLLGAYLAGLAVELSMLGATHACANPLTKNYGTTHGLAIAALLPQVVRWNSGVAGAKYAELVAATGCVAHSHEASEFLARRLEQLRAAGGLGGNLRALGVVESDLSRLAAEAAQQWTGGFNPRDWGQTGAMEVYQKAL